MSPPLANRMGSSAADVGEPCVIDRGAIAVSVLRPTVRSGAVADRDRGIE